MMKVGINARLLASPTLRGWNRYTLNLLKELSALGIELVLYSDQPLYSEHLASLPSDCYQVRIAPVMRYLVWEQLWLPQQLAKDKVDLFHCPFNFGLPWFSPCPRVLTLHEAIDPCCGASRTSLKTVKTHFYHWSARTCAEQIITMSYHAKLDLERQFSLSKHKVVVIYEAADARFYESISSLQVAAMRVRYQLRSPYILYVGGLEFRKNIPFLIQAFSEANLVDVDLVLIGGSIQEQKQLRLLAESFNIGEKVKFFGWAEDDLPVLYAGALCFVSASQYEDVGLHLFEAMASGCPILAAQATCLPEILGVGGIPFSIKDTQELSNCLRYLNADSNYRSQLGQRAQLRSQQFSWQRTAMETISVYEDILSRRKSTQRARRNVRIPR